MPVRRLPVRPNLEQLHRQTKEFLRAIHAGDENAIAELREHHPESIDPAAAKLADDYFTQLIERRARLGLTPEGDRTEMDAVAAA